MTIAEHLRAAAARVRKGWCQQSYLKNGKVCAFGAVAETSDFTDVAQAVLALKRFIGTSRLVGCIERWNDAPGQTAENVASTMEACADQWEAEQFPAVEWTHRELAEVSR